MSALKDDTNVVVYKTLENVETAVKIYNRIRLSFISLVSMDFAFFAFYLIFFITIQDRNWFDWLLFIEVTNILAMIFLLVSSSDKIYQSLYFVLAAAAICFTVNIIGIFMVRIVDVNNVTGNNTRRKNTKEVLLYMQISFTIYDFAVFILAFYYRFFSKLGEDVLARFARISQSISKYMQDAILLDIKETYQKEIALNLYEETSKTLQQQEFINTIKTAVGTNDYSNRGNTSRQKAETKAPVAEPVPVPVAPVQTTPPVTVTTIPSTGAGNKYTTSNKDKNDIYNMYGTDTQHEFSHHAAGLGFKKKSTSTKPHDK